MMRQFKIADRVITQRGTKALDTYMCEIAKYPVLSPVEEEQLATRACKGDLQAREKLIKSNLRFVVSVANSVRQKGVTFEDLINEGNIGLAIAADRFDPTRGFKFISYAVWWIRQCMFTYIQENCRQIRKPANIQNIENRIYREKAKILSIDGVELSDEGVMEELDFSDTLIKAYKKSRITEFKGDAYLSNDNTDTFFDVYASESDPTEDVTKKDLSASIEEVLRNKLSHKEYTVLARAYGLGCIQMTFEDIGREDNITRERARQICVKALSKLKTRDCKDVLRSYL